MGVKYSINSYYFTLWNNTMAYILGYLFADGSLEDASYLRGKYLRVSSTDLELIKLVRSALNSKHTIVRREPDSPSRKTSFLLRIGDKHLYNTLTSRGLSPNKSLTMTLPQIPTRHLSHFVRGFFDGDGHVSVEYHQKKFKRLRVVFTSGSYKFLENLADQLQKRLSLRINKIYNSHRSYRLAYSTEDSQKVLSFIYKDKGNYYLRRKYAIFKKFLLDYNK